MKVTHFQIARWGTASIHWEGKEEELVRFKQWVKQIIPAKHYTIEDRSKDPYWKDYDKTNLYGTFDLNSWVFCCYWWTKTHAPAIGQAWKPAGNYKDAQVNAKSTKLERSNGILQIAAANLERAMEGEAVEPEVVECLQKIRELSKKVNQRLNAQ